MYWICRVCMDHDGACAKSQAVQRFQGRWWRPQTLLWALGLCGFIAALLYDTWERHIPSSDSCYACVAGNRGTACMETCRSCGTTCTTCIFYNGGTGCAPRCCPGTDERPGWETREAWFYVCAACCIPGMMSWFVCINLDVARAQCKEFITWYLLGNAVGFNVVMGLLFHGDQRFIPFFLTMGLSSVLVVPCDSVYLGNFEQLHNVTCWVFILWTLLSCTFYLAFLSDLIVYDKVTRTRT